MQHLGSSCCKISGLLVLLTGLAFLAYGWGMWKDGMLVHLVAGLFLTLYALGKLAHAMDMCPNCQVAPESHPGRKK